MSVRMIGPSSHSQDDETSPVVGSCARTNEGNSIAIKTRSFAGVTIAPLVEVWEYTSRGLRLRGSMTCVAPCLV